MNFQTAVKEFVKTKEPPRTERYARWCGRSEDKIIIFLLPDLQLPIYKDIVNCILNRNVIQYIYWDREVKVIFKNKEGKVRAGWKLVAAFFLYPALTFLINRLVGIIIVFIVVFISTFYSVNIDIESLLNVAFIYDKILQNIILILFLVIFRTKFIKRPMSSMGLTPLKKDYKDFTVGLVFGIVMISVVFGILLISGNASVDSWQPRFSSGLLLWLLIFISVGFAEEMLTRGYIMSLLRQTKSLPMVVIISSAIFALLHSTNPGVGVLPIINIFLVGTLFAYMYIKSGNIWMPIGYHITWNYFMGNVYGFKVSGQDTASLISTYLGSNAIISGGDFGPEGGLVVTVITLLGFIFVKYYYRNSIYDFIKDSKENLN